MACMIIIYIDRWFTIIFLDCTLANLGDYLIISLTSVKNRILFANALYNAMHVTGIVQVIWLSVIDGLDHSTGLLDRTTGLDFDLTIATLITFLFF